MKFGKRILYLLAVVLLVGCAGMQRSCSSFNAKNFGSDWIVVQYRIDGTPFNCWKLENVGITNEGQSDGVYWKDSNTGHLVHISGWYNRVQVSARQYDQAAKLIGVDAKMCGDGVYPAPK